MKQHLFQIQWLYVAIRPAKFSGIRQRPTLPGDFACLNPAQRAAVKILTKYNAAHWSGQSEKQGVALLTLPGDIGPLFRPQGAGADILTKYIL